jgi:hypothetical protein
MNDYMCFNYDALNGVALNFDNLLNAGKSFEDAPVFMKGWKEIRFTG